MIDRFHLQNVDSLYHRLDMFFAKHAHQLDSDGYSDLLKIMVDIGHVFDYMEDDILEQERNEK